MNKHNKITEELTKIVEVLPEEKAEELIDFARYLCNEYNEIKNNSLVNKELLIAQQKTLSKIWDNPEENIYEL